MFGPNGRAVFGEVAGAAFSHRSARYATLIEELEALWLERCGLSRVEWDVLFITGSGTTANQAVLWSALDAFVVRGSGREFASRLLRAQEALRRPAIMSNTAWVVYETADAAHVASPSFAPGLCFADMVSAFPYYAPPACADVWTTVSSKQLGALPVLGIVTMRKSVWAQMRDASAYCYLNLARYKEAQAKGQPPHTPAIPLLVDLLRVLTIFDVQAFKARIDARREAVVRAFKARGVDVLGEGPVVTVPEGAMSPRVAREFDLYCSHLSSGARTYQLFLWSGEESQYDEFCKRIGV